MGMVQDLTQSINDTIVAVGSNVKALQQLKSTTQQTLAPAAPPSHGTSAILSARIVPGISNGTLAVMAALVIGSALLWKHG